jgi:hypothetical protein
VKRNEAKNLKRNEAKSSEKIGFSFSLEHAKTKRNGSYFASFRFEAKKIFKRNRRTLLACDVHLEQEDIDEATHPRLLPRGWCGGCMAQALYDPLGLVSPLMIQFKLAIRNLCTED